MNNKKKWASILTIATSLILCIAVTFGVTLAFFGGNASANLSTITLKTGIEIGAAIESSVGSAKVVPGQPVKITATGTVSATTQGTNPDANNAVDGVVRAKFNVGNELGTVTIAGNTTDYWTAGNDGYYYLVTAENGTTLRTVSKGTSVQIFGDLTVSKNFTNADSGKSVEASVIFEVVQADIYKADGTKETLTVANATTSTSPLYSSFQTVKYDEYANLPDGNVLFYNLENDLYFKPEYEEDSYGAFFEHSQYCESFPTKPIAIIDFEDERGCVVYYSFTFDPVNVGEGGFYFSAHIIDDTLKSFLNTQGIQYELFINVVDNEVAEVSSEKYTNNFTNNGWDNDTCLGYDIVVYERVAAYQLKGVTMTSTLLEQLKEQQIYFYFSDDV